jgi:hypothetical protein
MHIEDLIATKYGLLRLIWQGVLILRNPYEVNLHICKRNHLVEWFL